MLIKIRQKERVEFEEMLMIGDSFSSDIQPAIDLGINALHFNTKDFNQIYDYLTENKILDCEKFKKNI